VVSGGTETTTIWGSFDVERTGKLKRSVSDFERSSEVQIPALNLTVGFYRCKRKILMSRIKMKD